jgi:hypothetical protein
MERNHEPSQEPEDDTVRYVLGWVFTIAVVVAGQFAREFHSGLAEVLVYIVAVICWLESDTRRVMKAFHKRIKALEQKIEELSASSSQARARAPDVVDEAQKGAGERDPEKARPGSDPGWVPVFGKDHAPPAT